MDRRILVGGGAAILLVALAVAVPAATGWDVHVNSFPPLHAQWAPRVGVGSVPALLLAVAAVAVAFDAGRRLPWGRLLALTWTGSVAWLLALAYVDGRAGVATILDTDYEYLRTARATSDLPHTLSTYVERIPFDAPLGNWPVHIAGHPPGALTFFVVLDRLGLGSGFAAGLVVTLLAASTAVAVLVTLRVLGAEDMARRAAPFLVVGPAAIWQCVSADGLFAAVAAWGIAALALAARRDSRSWPAWSLAAGLLLGACVMLSYGLPLLGILAVTVLGLSRSWRPLVPAALAALAVVLAYAAFGYRWWEAIGVLRERYWDGVAHVRPASYWMWGNLAALTLSAGPVLGSGLAVASADLRARWRERSTRIVVALTAAGAAMVLAADASQMSKAEVERIWLPFVPWLLVSTALLPERWQRPALAVQAGSALVVQHLLATGW